MTRCAPPVLLFSLLLCGSLPPAAAQPACTEWSLYPTPNPGSSANRLTSIAVSSPQSAWAAGQWRNEPVGFGPLLLRFDGGAWQEVPAPSSVSVGTSPRTDGVAITPGGDVWVAGYVTTTYPTNNMPLLMRRRGEMWDFVGTASLLPQTVYPFAARGGLLSAIEAVSDDEVWAVGVGAGFGDGGATSVPLAVRWDGSSWVETPVPRIANRHHELVALAIVASDDIWAVGDYRNVAGAYRGMTYHWDGASWSHVPSPIEALPGSGLHDVAAAGPQEVWALGGTSGAVVLMRWNGSEWSMQTPPPNSGGSLVVPAPGQLWVSGWEGYWRRTESGGWVHIPVAVPGATYVLRSGGMAVVPGSGGCDIWTAGFWTLPDGVTSFTLAERLGGGGCYANCDGSTTEPILNVADFTCFLGKFAAGDPYANCDGSTTEPILNVADFTCFLNKFAAGCP
jgi:hypothetical protein